MKQTIPLKTLLEQITPLPWIKDEFGSVRHGPPRLRDKVCLTGFSLAMGANTKEADNNNAYVNHCANTLPKLVGYSTEFLRQVLTNGGASQKAIDNLQSALAAAEQVEI